MDCSIYGCVKKAYAAGLCSWHYEQKRIADAPPCKIDGCDAKAAKAGMCNRHYRQQKLADSPICTVVGCGRHQFVGGLCQTHHKRVQRYGSLELDQRAHDRGARERHPLYQSWHGQRRVARLCAEWRDDFWAFVATVGERPSPRHTIRRPDQSRPLGPDNWLWHEQTCSTEDAKLYQREWRKRNADRSKSSSLKKSFGIDITKFNRMLDEQGGVCAICRKPEGAKSPGSDTARYLAVDHCHATGRIRGLLCTGCNMMVGNCEKHPEVIDGLITYLQKHKASLKDG